jgi:hypothetical protein
MCISYTIQPNVQTTVRHTSSNPGGNGAVLRLTQYCYDNKLDLLLTPA